MAISVSRIQHYLKSFKFEKLFVEELGWDRHSLNITIEVDSAPFNLLAIAEKKGVQIFTCLSEADGKIPDYATRRKIEKQVTKSAYEHLIIFIDNANSMQIWQWVSRQPDLRAAYREHHYYPKYHSGESLVQKLASITFSLSEEEGLTLMGVAFKLRDAFDRDKLTKKFYEYFKKQHRTFLGFVQGITQQGDQEWYASLMLNRLMFIYFIQKKGFLDDDTDYLKNRLNMVQECKGKGKFLSFYRYFLLRLFHEGFAQQPQQRKKDLEDLLGKVPYLNGGLFELHELERAYPKIDIPDEAFEKLFAFFDQYEWHLDNRPLSDDKEINPDVLGYIFEKYINQKQMGAYYTKEDITEYISKNTIIPYLFDAARKKCAVAFQADGSLWALLRNAPLRYIHPAMTKGVVDSNGKVIALPSQIADGITDVKRRNSWNDPADAEYALPTETWREHVARRQRCLEIIEKLKKGKISEINDLITYNLDIRQFAEDAITECEGPELLRSFYQAIVSVTVLDPTCGSGAFLFAALNILEPLYDACLDRMQGFVDDLERSGKRHSPKKFSDFRSTLKEIDLHPSRQFFVLKSIVVNNLYGVDIMEEAVEICKLRLFLKLVAQVDKVKQLEPLPDVDFNIRTGNTLVGFTSVDEIRKAAEYDTRGQQQILLNDTKDEIKQIEEDAGMIELAFNRFHQMQTEQDMDAEDFKDAKKSLRVNLQVLAKKLDRYLAKEYRVNLENKMAFEEWSGSHRPFHWFIEFYGIINQGGFDVIIGNPPYVEMSKIQKQYQVKGLTTTKCGNIYCPIIEKSISILKQVGFFGMIVPMSLSCTKRMSDLRDLLISADRPIWISHFSGDANPSKLFEGVKFRLDILLAGKKSYSSIMSSQYIKWFALEREYLFSKITYAMVPARIRHLGLFPKTGSRIATEILSRILRKQPLQKSFDIRGPKIYVHRVLTMYVKCFNFIPYFKNDVDGIKKSEDYKPYIVKDGHFAQVVLSVVNSTTFFYYYITYGDCFHCGKEFVNSFPAGLNSADGRLSKKLQKIGYDLMGDMKKNAVRRTARSKKTGRVEYDEFWPKYSKSLIDEIDIALADHYGFNEEELDFLINYDFKYRMGAS